MKNTIGNYVTLTLFGESHGSAVGAVLSGIAPSVPVDVPLIEKNMRLRHGERSLSTPRRENDTAEILGGVYNGYTTGTPLAIVIRNSDVSDAEYEKIKDTPRPGHADYTQYAAGYGYADIRGGGYSSGRLTAPLVAVGTVAGEQLRRVGIKTVSHILNIGGVYDRELCGETSEDRLSDMEFPVLDDDAAASMRERISLAVEECDSLGGVIECAVYGIPAGVGETWFDSIEGVISHMLFAIPGVKGVEFGDGFALSQMKGSCANDGMRFSDGSVTCVKNSAGGVVGGISDGMPVRIRIAVKPTPSVGIIQDTVNLATGENTKITVEGRHDPAIVCRMAHIVTAAVSIAVCDLMTARFGTEYFVREKKTAENLK